MNLIDLNVFLPKEEAQKRYDICKQCDSFIPLTTQCKECGCVMKVKAKLRHTMCPLDKWKELNTTNE